MTSSVPSSLRLTDAKSGSLQACTAATRAARSGSIQAPVLTPTGRPVASRTATATASTTSGDRVSLPSAPRGCTWIAPAPAAAHPVASRTQASRSTGRAGCSAADRAPLMAALSSTLSPAR